MWNLAVSLALRGNDIEGGCGMTGAQNQGGSDHDERRSSEAGKKGPRSDQQDGSSAGKKKPGGEDVKPPAPRDSTRR